MDIYNRLAYLHQVQNLLNQSMTNKLKKETAQKAKKKNLKNNNNINSHEEEEFESPTNQHVNPFVKLNSFYGFLSKEIAMKHNIQM